jgi:hypothetical protein
MGSPQRAHCFMAVSCCHHSDNGDRLREQKTVGKPVRCFLDFRSLTLRGAQLDPVAQVTTLWSTALAQEGVQLLDTGHRLARFRGHSLSLI